MVSTIKKWGLALGLFLGLNIGFSQSVIQTHINYSTSDKAVYGSNFEYAPYRLNSKTDSLAVGMLFTVCDTFPDLISGNFYSKLELPTMRLDSLRIRINLSKHSSQNDTLIMGLAGSFNGVFPNENIFYGDTLIFNASYAPGHTYVTSAYYSIPVGVYVPISYSVLFAFKGHPNDTLTFWSGYGYDGTCAGQPSLKRAQLSHFFPNAFAYRKEFGQILPTFTGQDIFFNCDTINGFDTLTDGRNYIQNWDMDFYSTATTMSISENVFEKTPLLYPNPGKGTFYMRADCQQITVISSSGKEVWQGVPQGNSVYLPLPAGFYTVRIKTASEIRVEKLIITE